MLTVDEYGVICHDQGGGVLDGGDSVNWQGHRRYLESNSEIVNQSYFSFFKKGFGYCRHPQNKPQHAFYKSPWHGNMSRDQLTGVLAMLIKHGSKTDKYKFLLHHSCWGFFFAYNTVRNNDLTYKWKLPDLTGPSFWAMELRLLGLSSEFLDQTLIAETKFYNKNESTDPISFLIKLIVCRENYPTENSRVAWAILDKQKALKELWRYWCGWRGNCYMYELYKKKIGEL